MFLTAAEVAELTGYKHASKQLAMLRRQGVPFHVNAAGQPKVARATLEGRRTDPSPTSKPWEPPWAGSRARI